jgi:2-dehydro-3-deoxygalactonokinase
MSPEIAEWIAVDWGTSNLRVWLMGKDGLPFANAQSDQGMGTLKPDEFEPALLSLIDPYLSDLRVTPVMCAGMVGARQGWQEADYQSVPSAPPNAQAATLVCTNDPRISVNIIPGVKQLSPPDVMRGEETQIAGALKGHPDFDGVICLPGTHTKWVHISAGEIVSFQTFMTGELFALLSQGSVLRHSVNTADWDQAAFLSAMSDAMSRPQTAAAQLFRIRAGGLVADLSPDTARAQLSGILIGIELAGARPYWLGQNVAIIGSTSVAEHYRSSLEQLGAQAAVWNASQLTLAGLSSAYHSQKGPTK